MPILKMRKVRPRKTSKLSKTMHIWEKQPALYTHPPLPDPSVGPMAECIVQGRTSRAETALRYERRTGKGNSSFSLLDTA